MAEVGFIEDAMSALRINSIKPKMARSLRLA